MKQKTGLHDLQRVTEQFVSIYLKPAQKSLRNLEVKHGVRYSCLIQLPHFDPIKFAIVDPMHNLLLGTAKHVLFVWIKKGILL